MTSRMSYQSNENRCLAQATSRCCANGQNSLLQLGSPILWSRHYGIRPPWSDGSTRPSARSHIQSHLWYDSLLALDIQVKLHLSLGMCAWYQVHAGIKSRRGHYDCLPRPSRRGVAKLHIQALRFQRTMIQLSPAVASTCGSSSSDAVFAVSACETSEPQAMVRSGSPWLLSTLGPDTPASRCLGAYGPPVSSSTSWVSTL